ncbi:tRNA uracil 4-sulfurtransferase ThiI [Serratia rhizosphaerae]|uniref:tRNA uracil 4-sulfurtransferase ThiI n=1 Tax=unclassified Serratia (in: enterobacteria) TaxID=2647522 RepID=UPI000CF6F64A|nr:MULTISPECIES: tRNA uracil 4-sulfurtransferase ThiI [unclassified Serratia (in: enterobacteria)]MCA4821820.1 tRNA 4-thiouridine(8) synthase ThiI [Serratia rubidaea]AVJ16509.1 tRNA 4-thiouridine(8) synthase ThiI [Serratia sp. MYb239]QNK31549.1 tRNA 4-thiouridine(8) synthase ThiI [Serratia sp. JUb9]QPT14519.1 tRNA 4-thiouridine(8) synthase ThiI [Serratia rubidaea]CAE1143231.1 sulfurtransferase required for thiamine and 4-thiouridine biosynthesis [Serratia sp. Tan611]
MKFIIKLFPEITIKSQSVRLRFIKILTTNIRNVLKQYDENLAVVRHWDFIEVRAKDENQRPAIADALTRIPGIHHILEVEDRAYTDIHHIFEQTLETYRERLEGKTFCVRVKRRGKQDFSSQDVERYVGGGLNQHIESARVKLNHPQVTVNLEIEDDKLMMVKARREGIGGYPIGTQEDVMSLISGGFDSGVSSYMLMRRGCRVHYCFFNLGGAAHEIGVKQVAHYLWNRFGSSHKVRFVAIDFEPVVGEILEKVDDGQMGVVLKRMMVRAASKVAERYGVQALVTGEALGQVSSQTLTNLRLIDNASDTLILRPLISHDKEHIINVARQIGTEDFAKTMPEYCGVISKSPTVKAVKAKIEEEEGNFDFEILERVVREARNVDIRTIASETQEQVTEVETVAAFNADQVILDIRSVDEQDEKPLQLEQVEVKPLPFYKLGTQFGDLDQSKTYLLYCERGVMSRLQALYLLEQGYTNIKVYRP